MPNNIGTLVTSPIRPQGVADEFPTAYANELLGGHHQVTLLVERNNIPISRRMIGMTCYVLEVNTTFQLLGGIDNLNWAIYNSGGNSSSIGFEIIDDEHPIQDSVDIRLYELAKVPIVGSIKLFHEGFRLKIGIDNDFVYIPPKYIRINDDRDFDIDDSIIVDYRTSL